MIFYNNAFYTTEKNYIRIYIVMGNLKQFLVFASLQVLCSSYIKSGQKPSALHHDAKQLTF